jgi:hypothetical protein
MGDYVYAFSTAGASVHRTDDLELMVELELPGYETPETYYYEDDDEEAKVGDGEEDPGEEDQDSATVEG